MWNKVMNILEYNGINIVGTERNGNMLYSEIEFYSDAGEDVLESIYYGDGNGNKEHMAEEFIKGFRSCADDFDPDEHAEMWIERRGKNGVPETIRELINDADWIKEKLEDVARQLDRLM